MDTSLLLDARLPGSGTTALAVAAGVVVWTGDGDTGRERFRGARETLHLDGRLITPAFVDAHVHATSAGLLADGLDLSRCRSAADCLDAVARSAEPGRVLWGHGWDETGWPWPHPPSRAELDRAAGGAAVYLTRIDAHSAAVSSALLRVAPAAVGAPGWSEHGPLTRDAHHHVRRAALAAITPGQRADAQRAFLAAAAARGVAVVHECAGPDISGADDLAALRADDHGVEVVGYWGEPVSSAEQARDLLAATGAHGLAGDLFCDGALGSRTAALRAPYADAPAEHGARYLDAEQVAAHVIACTLAGTQAGFHVIGDAAVHAVIAGFAAAEKTVGPDALRSSRHRLEHLEMVEPQQARHLARWGVVASVQPAFDAAWGGPDGMYAQRLGAGRAAGLNPYAQLTEAGVVLAFGSDAPVTPVDPWAAVRAANAHHTEAARIPLDAALAAHTRGGHHAGGATEPLIGTLAAGAPASYAIWDATDPFAVDSAACLRTVHRGRVLHQAGPDWPPRPRGGS